MRRKTSYRPVLESLEARQLMAVLVSETEPNDKKGTADLVALVAGDLSAEIKGRISSNKDDDFFRIRAPETATLQVEIDSGRGLLGRVSIEDSQGNKLLETEPRDGVNSGTFTIKAGEDVFLRVRGHSKGKTGTYTVSLNLVGTPPDGGTGGGDGGGAEPSNVLVETEPNDEKSQANTASLGTDGILQLQGIARNDKDRDFFLLRPTVSGRLNVSVSSQGEFAKIEIEDRFGRDLLEIEPNDGDFNGSIQVTAGETYFLRVRSADKGASTYLVDLALTSGI